MLKSDIFDELAVTTPLFAAHSTDGFESSTTSTRILTRCVICMLGSLASSPTSQSGCVRNTPSSVLVSSSEFLECQRRQLILF